MLHRLQKAFDKVNHSRLIQVLMKYEVAPEEIRLISNLYWSQTAQIRGKRTHEKQYQYEH